MISCADLLTELGNYLDGEVNEDVRQQLLHHLSHCKTCSVLMDSTTKTLKLVTESDSFDLPAAAFRHINERIMEKIREQASQLKHPSDEALG